VAADYVSPFDERVRAAEPLAPRPASISGRRVVLLDIRKNRGAEFLDRIETLLQASEAFLASTIREVQSIGAIEDVQFDEGPRTREAAAAFREHVEAELSRAG